MSRVKKRNLLRVQPSMRYAVRISRGEVAAAMAVADRITEEVDCHDLMIQCFTPGKKYWLETAIWVYIGKCVHTGLDYILLESTVRVPVDGSHARMMRNGCKNIEGLELEPTGTPPRGLMRIPIDVIFANCEWVFDIPTESIG